MQQTYFNDSRDGVTVQPYKKPVRAFILIAPSNAGGNVSFSPSPPKFCQPKGLARFGNKRGECFDPPVVVARQPGAIDIKRLRRS